MKSTLFMGAALAAVAAINLTDARAQTADENAITVTGSRVITNGNNAPTPLTVIAPEQMLATKPTTVYETLVDMPAFSGSRGASNGPVTSSPNSAGGNQPNGAVSSLNLRNMGPTRNLVLFDGRRMPPASVDGVVDVSVLPQMLIQRVDVVTGGASAVYGSDAVTGVTNFIPDRNFNGLKINLQTGISQQDDAKTYQAGLAGGAPLFGGRGHIEASYQRVHDDGLYDTDRDWTKPRWTVQGNGTTIPWHLQDYAANNTASFGGAIACPSTSGNIIGTCASPTALYGQSFNQNGVLSTYNSGLTGAANGLSLGTVQIGGDGAYFTNVALKSKMTQDQAFARFDYDLTDDLHFFIMGGGAKSEVKGNTGTQRSFVPGWNIGACNAFLAPAYQTALGCTPANSGTASEPTFRFEKQFSPANSYGWGQNNSIENKSYFLMSSLEGGIGENFFWDLTYTHSQSKMEVSAINQNRQHIYAALDAVVNPANGQIVCRVTLTNPTANPGCIPLNPFGPTAASREAIYYLGDVIRNETTNKLDGFAGSLRGAPFSLWAGPIDMALSAELRKLTMDLDTNSLESELLNCTGLRFNNCNATVPVHPNTWLPVHNASQKISEAAYEINVPLLKDTWLFKNVNFNGAARYTEYKNEPGDSGFTGRTFDATTWKTGLTWDVVDALTVRWTRSRDIRAPSLYELYQPTTIGNTTNGFDYLQSAAGVAIAPRQKSGGNPFLNPEVGITNTLGIVLRPTPNFSVSVDYYRITMKDALYSLNGSNQVVQQACYASRGAAEVCQLQERPNGFTDTSAANAMTAFYTRAVNIAAQKTRGFDIEANWRTQLGSVPVSLRALITHQPHLYYYIPFAAVQDVAGVAYPQIGGLPTPKWRGSLFARFELTDKFSVDVSERWRSQLGFSSDPTAPAQVGSTKSVAYTNLSLNYDADLMGHTSSFFLNVQNLFDTDPPAAGAPNATFPGSFPGTYAVGDDVVGRYYTIGVRARF